MKNIREIHTELISELKERKQFIEGADFGGDVFMIRTHWSPVGTKRRLKIMGLHACVLDYCVWFCANEEIAIEDLKFVIEKETGYRFPQKS